MSNPIYDTYEHEFDLGAWVHYQREGQPAKIGKIIGLFTSDTTRGSVVYRLLPKAPEGMKGVLLPEDVPASAMLDEAAPEQIYPRCFICGQFHEQPFWIEEDTHDLTSGFSRSVRAELMLEHMPDGPYSGERKALINRLIRLVCKERAVWGAHGGVDNAEKLKRTIERLERYL